MYVYKNKLLKYKQLHLFILKKLKNYLFNIINIKIFINMTSESTEYIDDNHKVLNSLKIMKESLIFSWNEETRARAANISNTSREDIDRINNLFFTEYHYINDQLYDIERVIEYEELNDTFQEEFIEDYNDEDDDDVLYGITDH
jgi:hypothetical protein